MMFARCSCVIVLPSISVKTDWSFICCASSSTPCETSCGSKPSVSCMIGSSRILSLSISSVSSLDVVSICLPSLVVNLMTFILILPFWLFCCCRPLQRSSVCCGALLLVCAAFCYCVISFSCVWWRWQRWSFLMCWFCSHW